MSRRVIALSGWKRSGKDTVAHYLVERYGYTRIALADILKLDTASTYGLPLELMHDQALKEAPISSLPVIPTDPFSERIHELLASELSSGYWTPRALLILEGSIKRSVHSNYWVSRIVSQIRANPNAKFVITDMRYRSEADTFRSLFGDELETVRVERLDSVDTEDPSERDLDTYKFDTRLDNRVDTLDELHRRIDSWLLGQ